MNNDNKLYLVTMCDIDAPGKEDYLSGRNKKASIGKDRKSSVLPSEVDQFYTLKISDDMDKIANAEATSIKSTYFYYGYNLEELKYYVDLLLNQPTSEEAIARLQNGNAIPGDAYGDKKVTALIMSIDADVFDKLISMGLGDIRGAKYDTLDGYVEYVDNECSFGDLGFKKLCTEGEVVAYGGICEILRSTELWGLNAGYDATNNYAIADYVPSWTKMPEGYMADFNPNRLPGEVVDFWKEIIKSDNKEYIKAYRESVAEMYGDDAIDYLMNI